MPPPEAPIHVVDYRERMRQLTGRDIDICTECGGPMISLGVLKPGRPARPNQTNAPIDSS